MHHARKNHEIQRLRGRQDFLCINGFLQIIILAISSRHSRESRNPYFLCKFAMFTFLRESPITPCMIEVDSRFRGNDGSLIHVTTGYISGRAGGRHHAIGARVSGDGVPGQCLQEYPYRTGAE